MSEIATVWTAQPQGMAMDATLAIRSLDPIDFVPVRLPASIALRDVNGADVHHWSRTGDVLQVWLKQPAAREPTAKDGSKKHPWSATTLSILGHVAMPTATAKNATLPVPTMLGAVVDRKRDFARAAIGPWTLKPKTTAKEEVDDLGRTRYLLPTAATAVEISIKPNVVPPNYRTLTAASVQGGIATVTTHIHGTSETGNWPELQVRLRGWPSGTPRLHAPGFPHKTKHVRQGDDHVWTVTFPPGSPQQVSLSIGGRFAVEAGREFTVPEVQIERGGVLSASSVALVGAQPPAKLTGWTTMRRPADDLAAFPAELGRLRKLRAQFLTRSIDAGPLGVQPRETPLTAASTAGCAGMRSCRPPRGAGCIG